MAENEPPKLPAKKRRVSDKRRLESWKAIATYLNRSVRTVRRWESTENLPVQRHQHTKGFSVYAYQAELDEWIAENRLSLPDSQIEIKHSQIVQKEILQSTETGNAGRRSYYTAALVLALFVGGLAGRYLLPFDPLFDEVDLQPQTDTVASPQLAAKEFLTPVFSAWTNGRVREAFRMSQGLAQRLPDLPLESQIYVTDYLVGFWLTLGRVADAKVLLATVPDGDLRNALDAQVEFAAGDITRVREVLQSGSGIDVSSAPKLNVILAMLAMRDGDTAEAKTRLRSATSELVVADQGYYFVALDMLAGALKSEGKLAEAVTVLERTMPTRGAAVHNRSALFWLICQRNLANLYRESDRESDAVQIEDALRDWLVLADETYPLALSLTEA